MLMGRYGYEFNAFDSIKRKLNMFAKRWRQESSVQILTQVSRWLFLDSITFNLRQEEKSYIDTY